MRKLLISLAFATIFIPTAALAQAAPDYANVVASCGTVNGAAYAAGTNRPQTIDTSGRPCPAGGTPTGTQDVNIVQTGGVTQLRGAGAVGTGSERVAVGQDVTTIAGSAPGTAGTASANVITIQGIASGTVVPVSGTITAVTTITNPLPTTPTPLATSTAGLAPVNSSAVETSHVIKAGAGNLYSFNVSADSTLSAAAWEVLIFNSTTAPAAGAVTPVKCYQVPAGTTSVSGAWPAPLYLGTGISMTVSTATTCFTQTDSAHGFISGDAK